MLYYPIAISKDEGMQNYASVVPDVGCCFGFGDTIEETINNTKSLLHEHIATMLELNMPFEFKASPIESLKANPAYDGAIWALVAIDETAFDA